MVQVPTLCVCHGDDGGPRFHLCRSVQEALRAEGTVLTHSREILAWVSRRT
jgi:hypothetical protein